jgi:hypothetical protein
MTFFKSLIDFFTMGSQRPVRRLVAYYIVLGIVGFVLYNFVPPVHRLFGGEPLGELFPTPALLQDGLAGTEVSVPEAALSRLAFALRTLIVFLATIALMLPVAWVYMSTGKDRSHNQMVAQTLIVLPLVVAGIVLIVQNSLALAFSLAGVVAAVRFRTTLSDTRDVVYIFLAIAVGFASGVQVLTVAATLSILFNAIIILFWRYDFGRNVLEPTASARWADPLSQLAAPADAASPVPDRELVLALTPKKTEELAERFNRVSAILGPNGKKPRYNAVVTISSDKLGEAQKHVESVLDRMTKRWKLDEVIENIGKPCELYYLIRMRRSMTREGLITALRENAPGLIVRADVEVGEAMEVERAELKEQRKKAATS